MGDLTWRPAKTNGLMTAIAVEGEVMLDMAGSHDPRSFSVAFDRLIRWHCGAKGE